MDGLDALARVQEDRSRRADHHPLRAGPHRHGRAGDEARRLRFRQQAVRRRRSRSAARQRAASSDSSPARWPRCAKQLRVAVEAQPMLFGHSERMAEVRDLIDRVADTDVTVLIRGESGTGKELVARALCSASLRRDKPFVKVNCAALPADLLESELFGFERGAFTGAIQHKPGKFEFANHGTIFLDEIGEMSSPLQAKLLQVLQDGEFSRLGGKHDVRVDVRIVAATNRDLEQRRRRRPVPRRPLLPPQRGLHHAAAAARAARGDPGADRLLPQEVRGALQQAASRAVGGHDEACSMEYDWPGNVRELENLIKRTVVLGDRRGDAEGAHARHGDGRAIDARRALRRRCRAGRAAVGEPPAPAARRRGRTPREPRRRRQPANYSLKDISRTAARERGARADLSHAAADALEPQGDRARSSASATRRCSTRSRKTAWTRPHNVTTQPVLRTRTRKLLTPAAFEFVLDSELKRAVRSQNFLTLVTVEASREWEGMTVTADDGTAAGGRAAHRPRGPRHRSGRPHRQGHARAWCCSMPTSTSRPASSIASSRGSRTTSFHTPLRIAVGAACYPTHAVDADSLKRAGAVAAARRTGAAGANPSARSELR